MHKEKKACPKVYGTSTLTKQQQSLKGNEKMGSNQKHERGQLTL
jgi:hypothetical protein